MDVKRFARRGTPIFGALVLCAVLTAWPATAPCANTPRPPGSANLGDGPVCGDPDDPTGNKDGAAALDSLSCAGAQMRLDILSAAFRPDLPEEVFDFPAQWQGASEKIDESKPGSEPSLKQPESPP